MRSQPRRLDADREARYLLLASAVLGASVNLPLLARAALAAAFAGLALPAAAGAASRTPIRHLIVIIGENRSFDSVFGTYVPLPGQTVRNLLSKGIVDADGAPGPNWAAAAQHVVNPPLPSAFFVGAAAKSAYPVLPPPQLNGAPNTTTGLAQLMAEPWSAAPPFDDSVAPYLSVLEPSFEAADLALLQTGATGAAGRSGTDRRVPGAGALPDTAFQLTSASLPYDAYAGDATHRFFQMWQQSDCAAGNATAANPSGCLADLYPYVGGQQGDGAGGNALGFFNMQAGDAPYLKALADGYALSDNYHQGVMGGTAANHLMIGAGDALAWTPFAGLASPPAVAIADPDPVSPDSGAFRADGAWTECSDPAQPGVAAILDYLGSLPYRPAANCAAGTYYLVNNLDPAYGPSGAIASQGIAQGGNAPPSPLPTIGDALDAAQIGWAYYGAGYAAAVAVAGGATDFLTAYTANGYCAECNFAQYTSSIMTDATARAAHLKDAAQFFADLDAGRLPAVSFLKPDERVSGLPAASKLDLFEAFLRSAVDAVARHPAVFAHTAILVAFDESGGLWDSGYVQPLDFFGDGPRLPFLVVSPCARHGKVIHAYYDHASILKFIERNWGLDPLSSRSRDNLPNPVRGAGDPYVPANPAAIGDLFEMFNFAGCRA